MPPRRPLPRPSPAAALKAKSKAKAKEKPPEAAKGKSLKVTKRVPPPLPDSLPTAPVELIEPVNPLPPTTEPLTQQPIAEPELKAAPNPVPVPEVAVTEPPPAPVQNGAPRAPEAKIAPILADKTQELFAEFQATLKIPLIAYWTSTDGSICHNDVMALAQLLQNKTSMSPAVGLFLKSDGGSPEAALRLVHLLRSKFKKIILYAPYACASAATMVALGANEVHMGPTSYLTPVDTSLKHALSPVNSRNDIVSVSQDELSRILRLWNEQKVPGNPYPEVYKYLHPLVIGALDRSSSLSMRICMELLSFHMPNKTTAKKISHELNYSFPAHSYPITAREAAKLGLNIKSLGSTESHLLERLNALYCQMTDPIVTDYDLESHHNHEICNILEAEGKQIYYHVDKDFHYRKEERRWIATNDKSGWRRVTKQNGAWVPEPFALR